jgi:thiamine-phosphate pyrophosphorylase
VALTLRGFYGIVDRDEPAAALALAEKLLAGGACALQVRLKKAPADAILAVARALREPTRRAGAFLVVNDRVDLALAAGADAVHLGQDDLSLEGARQAIAGRPLLVGISTHNPTQAAAAARAGADYLGFGPVYATGTKENPDPVQGIAALAIAVEAAAPVPIVAIGGVTPARGFEIAATGAAAACAIAAVNDARDPTAAARRLRAAFE